MPPKITSLKLDSKKAISQFELMLYKHTIQKLAILHGCVVVILLLQMRNRGKGGALLPRPCGGNSGGGSYGSGANAGATYGRAA